MLARSKRNFSPEFREEAVKLVIETSRPIAQVARELGIGEGTLGIGSRLIAGITPGMSRLWVSVSGNGCGSWNAKRASCGWRTNSLKKPPRTSPRIIGE